MRWIFRSASLILAAVALLLALVPLAAADAVYHSQHIDLAPIGASPLQSGFVENIHSAGPQVYAHEVYVLNGALPDETYQVSLFIYPFDTSCSTTPEVIPVALLETNANGNGKAQSFFAPEEIPPPVRGFSSGVRWTVTSASSGYQTGCSTVTLD